MALITLKIPVKTVNGRCATGCSECTTSRLIVDKLKTVDGSGIINGAIVPRASDGKSSWVDGCRCYVNFQFTDTQLVEGAIINPCDACLVCGCVVDLIDRQQFTISDVLDPPTTAAIAPFEDIQFSGTSAASVDVVDGDPAQVIVDVVVSDVNGNQLLKTPEGLYVPAPGSPCTTLAADLVVGSGSSEYTITVAENGDFVVGNSVNIDNVYYTVTDVDVDGIHMTIVAYATPPGTVTYPTGTAVCRYTSTSTFVCEYLATEYGGNTQAAIEGALAAIGSDKGRLIITCGNWPITDDLTIPSNVEFAVLAGANLQITSAKTLTINGPFSAPEQIVFSGAGSVVFGQYSIPYAIPQWWGNDGAAIQKAINSYISVVVPPGSYTVSAEIDVINDYQKLQFNSVTLLAGVNTIPLIHWSASNGLLVGPLLLDANSHTGISGIRLTPVVETQTTTVVYQNYNEFKDLVIDGTLEGIVLQTGPDVSGTDSQCFYNRFENITINSTRGIWFKNGPNTGSASNNRNQFRNIRIGGTAVNTGVQIDAGDTNVFDAVHFEGIQNGTGPNVGAVAIFIAQNSVWSADNNSNRFFGSVAEACTSDLYNDNAYTELISCTLYNNPTLLKNPMIWTGYDAANTPYFSPGWITQANSQIAANDNGHNAYFDLILHSSKEAYDYGYKWLTYAITTGICVNVAHISEYKSKFKVLSGLCEWHFRMRFQASVAGTAVEVLCPIDPNSDLYRLFSTIPPMRFPVTVQNGAVDVEMYATFTVSTSSPCNLIFTLPSLNWNTAGDNNSIFATIRYHV